MGEEFKEFEVEAPVLTLEPDTHGRKRRNCKKRIGETPGACSRGTGVISPGTENRRRFCSKDRY